MRTAATAPGAAAAASQAVRLDVGEFSRYCEHLGALLKRAPVVPTLFDLTVRSVAQALAEVPALAAAAETDVAVRVHGETGGEYMLHNLASLSVLDIARVLSAGEEAPTGVVVDTPFSVVAIADVDTFAPALRSGAVAVLGLGAAQGLGAVADGADIRAPFVNALLSYDSRALSDEAARQFLRALRSYLEDPFTWLTW